MVGRLNLTEMSPQQLKDMLVALARDHEILEMVPLPWWMAVVDPLASTAFRFRSSLVSEPLPACLHAYLPCLPALPGMPGATALNSFVLLL